MRAFIANVNLKKGKSGGWPGCFEYCIEQQAAGISLNLNETEIEKAEKSFPKTLRQFDSWGIAFLSESKTIDNSQVDSLIFNLNADERFIHDNDIYIEAFVRRVSYLALNNSEINFGFKINGGVRHIYDFDELFVRNSSEVLRSLVRDRSDDDKPGRIEKDFQAFLFGKGKDEESRTNERLAVLGADFYKLQKNEFGIEREFPTGVFSNIVSKDTRVLPTEYVDIVTINKYGELSVIELKINDSQLEVISQLLDYSLYFSRYFEDIKGLLNKGFKNLKAGKNICCYVANNHYHQKFDNILEFYSPKVDRIPFKMKKITLGYTFEL